MNQDFVDLLRAFIEADDILTDLTGLTFAEAWSTRISQPFGDLPIDLIGRDAFVKNKRATGRLKDLADIEGL